MQLHRCVGRRVRSSGQRLVAGVCEAGAMLGRGIVRVLGLIGDRRSRLAARFAGAFGALVLMLVLAPVAWATDPLLPSTGVNISAMVTEVVTSLGAIVAVIVAAFFAFLLIRKALRWARSGF